MLKALQIRISQVAMFAAALIAFQQTSYGDDQVISRTAVADKLEATLATAEALQDPEKEVAHFQTAAKEAVEAMSANVFLVDVLSQPQNTKETDRRKIAKQWRNAIKEALEILRFQPKEEAPLPEGFPELTPVGEIRLQQYPRYRLAKTEMTLIEGRAFWTLFNHIKEREIAMTAPVEITYGVGEKGAKKASMAFLYRSTEQGEPGTADKVEVVDIPAQTAISIGIRGRANKERVADAQKRLEAWLQAHQEQYESVGPLRVMSHNSPFVADSKQYSEVQIPVRSRQSDRAAAP